MHRTNKILSPFILILYVITTSFSYFFHSHEEEHNKAGSFSLHSHHFNHIGNDEHSFDNEFHLSDNNYLSEEHIYSAANINRIFVPSAIIINYINIHLDINFYHRSPLRECISLSLRDSYVHFASNTSPPSV